MSRIILTNAVLEPLGERDAAVVIEGGRIAHVISTADVADFRTPGTAVLDAAGCTVLPGIDDSHLHGYLYGRSLTAVDLRDCDGLPDFHARLAKARPESSGWIRGAGWNAAMIPASGPDGTLCAADIDTVIPDVPAILIDVSGHQAVCNSAALARAGITAATADPVGGPMKRDAHGMPTGLLFEAAIGLVNDAIPPLTAADQRAAILTAQQALLAQGITAFTDPGLGPGGRTLMDGTGDMGAVQAYQDLDQSGELLIRAHLMLLFGGLGGTRANDVAAGLDAWGPPIPGAAYSHLDIGQVKVFADGIPRSRTAWVTEPYDDCTHGHLQVAGETDADRVAELNAIVAAAISRGWQVGAHCVGDRTITSFLDAVEAAAGPPRRHYVIHGDLVSREDLARMQAMGSVLNTNPSIRWMLGRAVNAVLGDTRNLRKQPMQTAWNLGVRVATSSDAPVMPPDWQTIIAAAITRCLRDDTEYTDDEALTAKQAVESLTINGAWQSHAESWRGDFTPGKVADVIVLDGEANWADPWSLPERNVRATMVDGVLVHGSLDAA